MKEMKKLEDVLKEKFSDREMDQNSELLGKIFTKIHGAPEKKKNYIPLLMAASITGILLIAGIYFLFFRTGSTGVEIAKEKQPAKEIIPIDIPLAEKKTDIVKNPENVPAGPDPKKMTEQKEFKDTKKETAVVFSSYGSKAEYVLPDSSRTFLNRSSHMALTAFDAKGRTVTLEGEAFFEVKNASGLPFTVLCGDARIQVVGTSFNVRTFGRDSVEVAVVEGKVKFGSAKNNSVFVFLAAGEKALLYNGTLNKETIKDPNYFVWKTDVLAFNKTSIAEAIETMQTYFNTKIHISDKALLNCHISGKFKKADIEKVFQFFNKTLEIEYLKKDNEYYLTGKGCN